MKTFTLLFLFSFHLFSYSLVEILNETTILKKISMYIDENSSENSNILEKYLNATFDIAPKNAYSFGSNRHIYWFAFEITSSNENKLFLRIHNNITQNVSLYTYQNNLLLGVQTNGGLVPLEQRKIQEIPLIFELGNEVNKKIFLLRIQSKSPIVSSFMIGTQNEIHKGFEKELYLFIFLSGFIFLWTLYNLLLYLTTKETTYLYYTFYIMGSYFLMFFILGYGIFLNGVFFENNFLFIAVLLKLLGLGLFTNKFLDLYRHPKIAKFNILLVLITSITFFLLHYNSLFSILLPIFLYLLFLYYGFLGLKRYFYPSLFYLIATGVALTTYILFIVMMDIGGLIPYSFYTLYLPLFGLIWDIVFLSIAISYKLKILQNEKEDYKKMLLIKSNIDSIGQLNANIIHQWKTPLAEIGSINTNLLAKIKYDKVDTKKIISSLELIGTTLQEISKTVEFFYQQYSDTNNHNTLLSTTIKEIHLLFFNSFKEKGIILDILLDTSIKTEANKNIVFQILLILLTNAKEQFSNIKRKNKKILISLYSNKNNTTITVEDNAGGIICTPIEGIFEPYYSTKKHSSGLGLYIAKKLVEESNIEIGVYNKDNGATFFLRFENIYKNKSGN